MALDDDRRILIAALESAMRTYQEQIPRPTFLSGPSEQILDEISGAIGTCSTFAEVAGRILYSGGSGPIVSPHLFATHLFYRAERNEGKDIPQAADWLLRLLATREATGFFKAAIGEPQLTTVFS